MASFRCASDKSTSNTFAPSAANNLPAARPMPPAPPVMIATFPSNRATYTSPSSTDCKRVVEVRKQVVRIFDANRYSDQRIGNSHTCAPCRAHLEVDRMRDGNCQCAIVAQVAGFDDDIESIQEVE